MVLCCGMHRSTTDGPCEARPRPMRRRHGARSIDRPCASSSSAPGSPAWLRPVRCARPASTARSSSDRRPGMSRRRHLPARATGWPPWDGLGSPDSWPRAGSRSLDDGCSTSGVGPDRLRRSRPVGDVAAPIALPRRDLHRILVEGAAGVPIRRRRDDHGDRGRPRGGRTSVSTTGRPRTVDLLVGADGIHSSIRQTILGGPGAAARRAGGLALRRSTATRHRWLERLARARPWVPGARDRARSRLLRR